MSTTQSVEYKKHIITAYTRQRSDSELYRAYYTIQTETQATLESEVALIDDFQTSSEGIEAAIKKGKEQIDAGKAVTSPIVDDIPIDSKN